MLPGENTWEIVEDLWAARKEAQGGMLPGRAYLGNNGDSTQGCQKKTRGSVDTLWAVTRKSQVAMLAGRNTREIMQTFCGGAYWGNSRDP